MKHIKSSLLALAVGLCIVSCNNSKTEETQSADSTNMTAPAPDNTMSADTTTVPTGDTTMNNSNGATDNTGSTNGLGTSGMSGSSSSGARSTGSSAGNSTSGTHSTTIRTTTTTNATGRTGYRDTRSGVAKTGEYNSDIKTPAPPNLDDRRLRNHPPAHTYGDTANLKTGAVQSVR